MRKFYMRADNEILIESCGNLFMRWYSVFNVRDAAIPLAKLWKRIAGDVKTTRDFNRNLIFVGSNKCAHTIAIYSTDFCFAFKLKEMHLHQTIDQT